MMTNMCGGSHKQKRLGQFYFSQAYFQSYHSNNLVVVGNDRHIRHQKDQRMSDFWYTFHQLILKIISIHLGSVCSYVDGRDVP